MARIEEKIAEIADPALRQIIAEEVANLEKHTRFGLVFEDHQPEVVPIYGKRIKRGERVAKKTGNLAEIWRVVSVKDGIALCEQEKGGKTVAGTRVPYPTQQLVVIRSMGETIYPSLTPVDSVSNGDNHIVDILEPHSPALSDNYAKAKGLAQFAAKHAMAFGRIEMIRIVGNDIRRLDLIDAATRKKVLKVDSDAGLDLVFDIVNA